MINLFLGNRQDEAHVVGDGHREWRDRGGRDINAIRTGPNQIE